MEWVLNAYWICLLVGIGYTIVSFLLGGLGEHADISTLGHTGGFGHGGHAGADADAGQVIFGPFSPLVIAFFLACMGATGIVETSVFGLKVFISFPVAIASAVLLAWLMVLGFNRLLGGLQSSSEVKLYTLVGVEAEVTVDIPVTGVGEIAYVAMGSRYVAPARSEDAVQIPRFSGVRITRLVGNMFYVAPMVEEQLRNLDVTPTGGSQMS